MQRAPSLFQAPFYFLRHGETDTNRLGLIAGQRDVALNAVGRRQALAAAQRLKSCVVGAIYSSPLARARDTAQCVAAALGLPVTVIAELAERNWGELEGKPRALRVLEENPAGGEGAEEFAERTLAGLHRIAGGNLPLIVAHSGTYRVLCRRLGIVADDLTSVLNCEPLRVAPVAGAGERWSIVPCACV